MLDKMIQAVCSNLEPPIRWALHFHPYATTNVLIAANLLLIGFIVYRVTRRSEVR